MCCLKCCKSRVGDNTATVSFHTRNNEVFQVGMLPLYNSISILHIYRMGLHLSPVQYITLFTWSCRSLWQCYAHQCHLVATSPDAAFQNWCCPLAYLLTSKRWCHAQLHHWNKVHYTNRNVIMQCYQLPLNKWTVPLHNISLIILWHGYRYTLMSLESEV